MKLIILFTLAFLFATPTVFADEFIVKSFKPINNKILTNSQKVYDDNDELCAIIMVRTSLVDLGISASTPIVGNAKWEEGDYKVYVTAGTRMIKFYKRGFETLEYIFSQRPEKGVFYLLELEYRRTDVAAAGNTMGFVLINSTPQGADVTINGEATGLQTPFQNPYNEGYYTYSLKLAQYLDYTGNFTIVPDETKELDVALLPNFGSLKVVFTPSTGVTVNIDGVSSTQNSSYNVQQLTLGTHTLALSKNEYISHEQDFSIKKGETTTLNINLQPNFADLIISTSPEVNAKVTIDNKEYSGTTPLTLKQFAAGKHSLRLSKSMYLSHQKEFTVEKGVPLTIDLTLTPTFGVVDISAELNADIYIDKQKMGSGSYNGRLLKGTHIIEIKKENYTSQSKQLEIVVGNTHTEHFILVPKIGVLSVMSTPAKADVYLNNELQGQSPKFINNLIIGNYTLKLQKQGYTTIEKQVEITENQTTMINETLRSSVEVQITSTPAGAKLYVDELYKGITPQTVSLSFGSHRFKLEKIKYIALETTKTISITSNKLSFTMSAIVIKAVATNKNSTNLDINSEYSGSFTDTRNGQTYKTVKIGKQTWMAENLNYKTKNSFCYDNDKSNCNKYGRLYNWDAAKKACPTGWHLPSDNEWKQLEIHLGMIQSEANGTSYRGTDEGEKMKSKNGWKKNGNGTNSSGFNALAGGYRYSSGSFYSLGYDGDWWSSSEYSGTHAWNRYLSYSSVQVNRGINYKTRGFSVRCLKN